MRLEEDLVIRRSRPTMISPKYRAREERRRLLKISAGKLRRIEDPETSLCRSVLINNAVKRLQRENRDEKRSYGLPVVSYIHNSAKENNISGNILIDVVDNEASSRKRLNEDIRSSESSKRQRNDDLALSDDVFSDFYIFPSTPRLLSHFENMTDSQSSEYHALGLDENRLGNADNLTHHNSSEDNAFFTSSLSTSQRTNNIDIMEANNVDSDRICDYTRFVDSPKTLEERLVDLQNLDEHFDLTKYERNNNQSCGRAFHDIQTFHSLVPGLET